MRGRDRRGRELAMIHVGKTRLGLDDAAYRSMLFTLTGKSSAADLDAAGRARVIESLKKDGAYVVRSTHPHDARSTQPRDDRSPFDRAWAEIRARVPEFRNHAPAFKPPGVPEPAQWDDHKALFLAAWHWLGEHGHLTSGHWQAAGETSFCRRVAGVAHLRWCTPAQTNKLVEAVKAMVRRAVSEKEKA